MASLNTFLPTQFGRRNLPGTITVRFGSRELSIGPDFRNRYYSVSPMLDCRIGVNAGHLELLLFRKWLVILSKAR